MNTLIPVTSTDHIPPQYRDTPVGRLLEYHNLARPLDPCSTAQLLIGMCMDNRKHLRIPDNFAFIIRTGGANLRFSEFKVSYAIAVGGVRCIALIGHTQCGMVNLVSASDSLSRGWSMVLDGHPKVPKHTSLTLLRCSRSGTRRSSYSVK